MANKYKIKIDNINGYELRSVYTPDNHYIGDEDRAKYLIKEMGISPELASPDRSVCSIGFCDKEQKWYGWSHRAIYGFGIGSHVKFGDCAYRAPNKEKFIEQCINFWKNPDYQKGIEAIEDDAASGVVVYWIYNNKVPNKDIRGTGSSSFTPYPKNWGRGEWTALTLDDARQMAIDFAEGVS